MSDRMTPMPFHQLMEWIMEEKKSRNTVFGIHRPYVADRDKTLSLFGGRLETPFGPAAGPHTQLAQNIIASYYVGGRFFELKTVQILDGEELPVEKPCILADDECYNVEWSTELYVPQALEEYIKAWFAIRFIAREFGTGSPDGFLFNMSVGYDLEGIRSKKIDDFIEGLRNADNQPCYHVCRQYLMEHLDEFQQVGREDIEQMPTCICNCVTLSTLHGCPPREIERIAVYLLEEKGLHTFIKCNPTLLGYDFARKILDEMGYGYISFDDFHFKDDLQYADAVPMLNRLMALAESRGLSFGVKITNTFPVDVTRQELPGKEMYMSGRSLYPLSISLAAKLAKEFEGRLRISYSGGADYYNIDRIFEAGIWPVTVATTVLKPGGYQRMEQIARKLGGMEYKDFTGIGLEAVTELAGGAAADRRYIKSAKPLPDRKIKGRVPLTDCFTAPCKEGCPIRQDITCYMKLASEGRHAEALKVITDKNPLPFITGTICPHNCMSKCTRNFYEEPVQIRDMKKIAAEGGYDTFMKELSKPAVTRKQKAAVVGGGPGGLAAAYFLSRAGMSVTLFEKKSTLGGVVRHMIPEFRIPLKAIERDIELVKVMGAEIITDHEVVSIRELRSEGYDFVLLAIGAGKPAELRLEQGKCENALTFLERFKKADGHVSIGENIVVVGGGNTAMDAARAAIRADGARHVRVVYRRTKRYMPADEEELLLAQQDGVEFLELLAPVSQVDGKLLCRKMTLGEMDGGGRRNPVETDEYLQVTADTVIGATGENVDTAVYESFGIDLDEKGYPMVAEDTMESGMQGVYIIGDGVKGPATVVEAIRDAKTAAEAILGGKVAEDREAETDEIEVHKKKGILREPEAGLAEGDRCLTCSAVCENCAEVCPNRANLSIQVPGMGKSQILHVDYMCNECGNCRSFCPYDSAPYLDKFTLFANEEDLQHSENEGFVVLNAESGRFLVRHDGRILEIHAGGERAEIAPELIKIMETVCTGYSYLLS